MNERIKELQIQAEAAADEIFDRKGKMYGEIVMEKFAELIVAECLKIAKNREDEFESAGLLEQSNAVGNVAYRISRQFGVKR
jgi:hypothetical protein